MDELTAVGHQRGHHCLKYQHFMQKISQPSTKTSSPMATKIFSCGWRNAGEDGGGGGGGVGGVKFQFFRKRFSFSGDFY